MDTAFRLAPQIGVTQQEIDRIGVDGPVQGLDAEGSLVAPDRIDHVINSHLHFDHRGGNEQLPNATLLLQRFEWEAASVVCLPTPGHTPGHQSLRVRTGNEDVVLTGDACYLRCTLDDLHLPTTSYDREQMRASLRRLRALRDKGTVIITGHDPEMWETIPQAPALFTITGGAAERS